ncbi:hypothetical protein F5J12DRAFT_895123 [Pisolithus orientalis]|uniref:uncharacterized protein n=1 Tax=Pisolithus orientalis TaxID=936130 RepID=UPI0022259449|nr:uncharacterized protein F5J12DRAFT_895123 [Pisolithus orientalis]KAI5999885.1 hypothetical protein F5J12DRAFT_895123 [Pisolithus orientalis]
MDVPPQLQSIDTQVNTLGDEELQTVSADEDNEEPVLSFEDQLEDKMENGFVGKDFIGPSSSTEAMIRCHQKDFTDFSAKLHDQLLCVCGFTPVNKLTKNFHSSSGSDSGLFFIVGNPFVTLVHLSDHMTSLVLVCSTSIYENSAVCNDIHTKTLQANGSKIKISGNILVLVPSESTLNSRSPDFEFNLTWIWTGAYLKTSSTVPGPTITTQKLVEVTAIGSLVELVNPSVVLASAHLAAEKTKEINSQDLTWSLKNEALKVAVDLIWKCMLEMKILVSNIALL